MDRTTHDPKTRTTESGHAFRSADADEGAGVDLKEYAPLLEAGTLLRLRARQRLPFQVDGDDVLYFVQSGALVLQVVLKGGRQQVLEVVAPGEFHRAWVAPPLPDLTLKAGLAGQVVRIRRPIFERMCIDNHALRRAYARQVSRQQSALSLHVASIGRLTSDERVASFITELALRLGKRIGGRIVFDMPLSRTEVADYLALNPDTLSRVLSRFKQQGIVITPRRSQLVVRDWAGLTAATPLADALARVFEG